ncbi:MAG TPA: hypothetical protein PLZ93_01070 [Nocardioides sp.]|uniref:hypothetical protein n=1 Tax=uncultured Nocardioides sp. TaxID=198441 RepID=UPI000EBF16DB|nr:hypothetical protein [uncultured Nocardioides sp.]HCB04057.1 hypothetical protein [Nocardioides sp.]HRD61257.1 hypothetical protein [Nocardioides sp.]HRI94183.1 hypothetical protein [Nocardioides sp.]HRK44180.1 hypothetical protein [Nocardioides sp.]
MTTEEAPSPMLTLPTVLQRAEYLAAEVELDVNYDPNLDSHGEVLALLAQAEDSDGGAREFVLLPPGIDDDLKAAGIVFTVALLALIREYGEPVVEAWKCREEGAGGDFIAVSRNRLPLPNPAKGPGHLAALMGYRMGLLEPAIFELMGARCALDVSDELET